MIIGSKSFSEIKYWILMKKNRTSEAFTENFAII